MKEEKVAMEKILAPMELLIIDEDEKKTKVEMKDDKEKPIVKDLTEFNEFKKRRFLKSEMGIPSERVQQDKAFISKCLRSGIELETPFLDNQDGTMRTNLQKMITGTYAVLNDYGVERFYADGTISPCGYEIVFTGSNENFNAYRDRLAKVERRLKNLAVKGYETNNGSSSCHITLLTSQQKKLPMIYLMNFYQLYRKYCDVLLWLGSATYEKRKEEVEYLKRRYSNDVDKYLRQIKGLSVEEARNLLTPFNTLDFGDDDVIEVNTFNNLNEKLPNSDRIVRRGLLQYANPIMTKSPIKNEAIRVLKAYGKYRGINFDKQSTTRGNGALNGIMVEIRTTDRIPVPSALTSIKAMYEAMLLKAIDLSQYGILNVECNGVLNAWQKTKECVAKMCEGKALSEKDISYLQRKAKEFIHYLKPQLMRDNSKAVEILEQLAIKPISIRYREGKTNAQIEKELYGSKKKNFKSEIALRQIIDLLLIEANSSMEWKKKASKMMGISERSVEHNIAKINESGEKIFFDEGIKSYMIV